MYLLNGVAQGRELLTCLVVLRSLGADLLAYALRSLLGGLSSLLGTLRGLLSLLGRLLCLLRGLIGALGGLVSLLCRLVGALRCLRYVLHRLLDALRTLVQRLGGALSGAGEALDAVCDGAGALLD